MFMTKKKSTNYPLRADETVWNRVKDAAEVRGAPLSVLLDRLMAWFVDQDDATQAAIMRYSVDGKAGKSGKILPGISVGSKRKD